MRHIALMLLLFASPKATLQVTPRMAIAPINGGVLAKLRVVVKDPGPALYCPKIEVEWTDETISTHESDCEPWDELAPDDPVRKEFIWTKSRLLGQGKHTFKVTLTQGKERIVLRESMDVY